jgi:hypothetical protein
MKQRTYTLGLALCFALVWVVVTAYVSTTATYTGDMTRLGGYREQDFAPRAGEEVFTEQLWTQAPTLKAYDRPYDVVVVGDSFSQNTAYGWENYLREATGWSIITFHSGQISVPELLESETFRQHPPKLFVYEIVEHGLHTLNPGFGDDAPAPADTPPVTSTLSLTPEPAAKIRVLPDLSPSFNMSDGVHRLQRDLKRLIGTRDKAICCQLTSDAFFTNRLPGAILYYHGDTWKNAITPAGWAIIAQRVRTLRERVEANGVTHFVFMLAPDKSTVFRDYIQSPPTPILNTLELLPDAGDLPRLPLHEAIGAAVASGEVQDIYLPNDAHWGNAGHRIAARTLLEYLDGQGVISPQ